LDVVEQVQGTLLEAEIERLDGVLGAVILQDRNGSPSEVQVFTRAEAPDTWTRENVMNLLQREGHEMSPDDVMVFKLKDRMPENKGKHSKPVALPSDVKVPDEQVQTRPRIHRISLEVGGRSDEANVSLVMNGVEAVGKGRSTKTPHGLRVTAAATLEAAQALVRRSGILELKGASLVETLDQKVVVVLVQGHLDSGGLMVGAALVGESSIHEATVRATLDAVNRQLDMITSL
jgi:hypothetical protein